MLKLFTKHPQEVGESYLRHGFFAFCMALKMIGISFIWIIHGLFPFLFTCTATQIIINMAEKFSQRRKSYTQ